jgi:hypothetical protein
VALAPARRRRDNQQQARSNQDPPHPLPTCK